MADFVVIGAGLTGVSAAIALRKYSVDARVTLIGEEDEAPYERPPLSKGYLRGELPIEKLLVRPREFYQEQAIDTLFGSRACRIDGTRRIVHVEGDRRVPYDRLLIATGVRNRRPPIPGIDLQGVHQLRTIRDATRLRAEMRPGRKAVVVGMGFIGCEVAASLRHHQVEVVAIDPGPTPLARVLGEAVGGMLAALHASYGVHTVFSDTVEAFEGNGRIAHVITNAGLRIPCDFAVVGVGVEPVVDFLDGSGIRIDNGIAVDQHCATSVGGIFAAGDVANHFHPVFGRHIRVEHWQNAMRHGDHAARNMLGERIAYDDIPWFWSDQYDANIQYAGHHTSYEELILRGQLDGGSYAAFYMNGGVIDAVVGINNAKDVRRAMPLIKGRRPVDPGRLRDESVDLRSLAATPSDPGRTPSSSATA
jgi:3-phenylpropionate/trans-cinnamate dioxygenase ferredoxin reductase subunit